MGESREESATMATGSSLSMKRKLGHVKGKKPIEEIDHPPSPWSRLPTDLLPIISQKLAGNMSDFIGFRCVCRSWRHAAKPSDLSPQLPWLLLLYDPESSSRSFFRFADKSTRTLLLPETINQNIRGSSNGWLIMHDKALNFSLFNPITGSLFRLPPITSFLGHGYCFKEKFTGDVRVVDRRGVEVTLEDMTYCFDCFAFVSPDPESVNSVDGVVALMVANDSLIQYCKLGDAGWTVIDPGLGWGVKTMAFHKGNFYFVDHGGRTSVCELGPVKKEAVVIPPVNIPPRYPNHGACHYLVTLGEELLLVSGDKKHSYRNKFAYHKLEVGSGGTMNWSRVGGAVDCTLFLTDPRFHYVGRLVGGASRGRLMTVASSAPGYQKGCVYYVVPPGRDNRGLSPMQVIMVDGGGIGRCHWSWPEGEPKPMSPSWIVPSLC